MKEIICFDNFCYMYVKKKSRQITLELPDVGRISVLYGAPMQNTAFLSYKISKGKIRRWFHHSPHHTRSNSPKRATPARHVVSNPEIGLICPPKAPENDKTSHPHPPDFSYLRGINRQKITVSFSSHNRGKREKRETPSFPRVLAKIFKPRIRAQ